MLALLLLEVNWICVLLVLSLTVLLKNAYHRRDTLDAVTLREQQALEEIEKLKALLAAKQS